MATDEPTPAWMLHDIASECQSPSFIVNYKSRTKIIIIIIVTIVHDIRHWEGMTRESFSACQQVENYLLQRLKYDHPNVKRKALQIIKSVAMHGDVSFARNIARKTEDIKIWTSTYELCLAYYNESLL